MAKMIIIFTGNGKGKTTAALGQAMRMLGWGKRVVMIQFIKGNYVSGEHLFVKRFKIPDSRFKIIRVGKGFVKIFGDKLEFTVHKKAAQKALALTQKTILSKKYDLVILDEINMAVNLRLIKASDVLKILKFSPVDIILTGRGAPRSFIKLADIVTEMKEIKYLSSKGKLTAPQKGIEY